MYKNPFMLNSLAMKSFLISCISVIAADRAAIASLNCWLVAYLFLIVSSTLFSLMIFSASSCFFISTSWFERVLSSCFFFFSFFLCLAFFYIYNLFTINFNYNFNSFQSNHLIAWQTKLNIFNVLDESIVHN